MKTLLLVLALVPSLVLAQEKESEKPADPMAGWVPPKVKSEAKDKQEIQAVFRAMEAASRTGDLDAAAALVDFPVTMMTDDSKGQGMGEAWSREQWMQVMKPFYDKPMKDAKVTHKPTIFLLSDSLASVSDVYTMTQGGKSTTARTATFLVRKDGKWRVKAMAEGGWGDMMATSPATATGGQREGGAASGSTGSPQSTEGSTSGSKGGAQGTERSPSGSTGGVTEPPGSQKGESDVQTPKEKPPTESPAK